MKNRLWTTAGALALLAVLGKYYALPAIAQTVRAAIVKNIDERGRNAYVYNFTCNPTAAGYCYATGAPVIPAGTRLVVENINIFGIFAPTGSVTRTALAVNTAVQRLHDVTGGTTTDAGGGQSVLRAQFESDRLRRGRRVAIVVVRDEGQHHRCNLLRRDYRLPGQSE